MLGHLFAPCPVFPPLLAAKSGPAQKKENGCKDHAERGLRNLRRNEARDSIRLKVDVAYLNLAASIC